MAIGMIPLHSGESMKLEASSETNGHFRSLNWRYLYRPYVREYTLENMARNMVLSHLHFRILKYPLKK